MSLRLNGSFNHQKFLLVFEASEMSQSGIKVLPPREEGCSPTGAGLGMNVTTIQTELSLRCVRRFVSVQ